MTRALAVIGALGIVVALGAGAFFFGGFYDIAASGEDSAPVAWALIHVREASLKHFGAGAGAPPVKLDDPAVVRDGARAFAARGCVQCHGAPGAEWSKFSEGLNPGPPDLKEVAGDPPAQLFWVIKHGIRMTGMPSFEKAGVPDDEIWKIAAFVRKLPDVSEADYKAWTAPPPAQ